MNRQNASWFFHGHRQDSCIRPAHHHHSPRHVHHPAHKPTATEMLQRDRQDRLIIVSATKLRKWQSRLESIAYVREAIKDLDMSSREKQKLYGLTTQLKTIMEDIKGEMKEKLRG